MLWLDLLIICLISICRLLFIPQCWKGLSVYQVFGLCSGVAWKPKRNSLDSHWSQLPGGKWVPEQLTWAQAIWWEETDASLYQHAYKATNFNQKNGGKNSINLIFYLPTDVFYWIGCLGTCRTFMDIFFFHWDLFRLWSPNQQGNQSEINIKKLQLIIKFTIKESPREMEDQIDSMLSQAFTRICLGQAGWHFLLLRIQKKMIVWYRHMQARNQDGTGLVSMSSTFCLWPFNIKHSDHSPFHHGFVNRCHAIKNGWNL